MPEQSVLRSQDFKEIWDEIKVYPCRKFSAQCSGTEEKVWHPATKSVKGQKWDWGIRFEVPSASHSTFAGATRVVHSLTHQTSVCPSFRAAKFPCWQPFVQAEVPFVRPTLPWQLIFCACQAFSVWPVLVMPGLKSLLRCLSNRTQGIFNTVSHVKFRLQRTLRRPHHKLEKIRKREQVHRLQ